MKAYIGETFTSVPPKSRNTSLLTASAYIDLNMIGSYLTYAVFVGDAVSGTVHACVTSRIGTPIREFQWEFLQSTRYDVSKKVIIVVTDGTATDAVYLPTWLVKQCY